MNDPLQYYYLPLGLVVDKVVALCRDTIVSAYYAAVLVLPRNMTIPSHMNHTI